MRKLLVVLLALVVGVFLYAENVTVEWTGSANFALTVDENGVDVDGGAAVTVSWAPTGFSAGSSKVTATFSLGCCGGAGFGGITFDGDLMKISYVPGAASLGQLFTGKDNDGDGSPDGVGNDYASFTFKAIDMLTVYYVDLLEETTTNAGSPAEKSYFDDFVAAEVSKDLGVVSVDVLGAYYDTDATSVSNKYEYAGEVSVTGGDMLTGLEVWAGFGNSVASGTVYGVTASYDYSLVATPVTVEVAPSLKYTKDLAGLAYSSFTDGKEAAVKASVSADVSPVTVTLTVDPTYDFTAKSSPLTVPFTAKAEIAVTSDISASAEFDVDDLMDFAGGWDVTAGVIAAFAPISVEANVLYNSDKEFGYNASVGYIVEEGLEAKAFYGTLYDAGNGVAVNKDAQWYLTLSYSASF